MPKFYQNKPKKSAPLNLLNFISTCRFKFYVFIANIGKQKALREGGLLKDEHT